MSPIAARASTGNAAKMKVKICMVVDVNDDAVGMMNIRAYPEGLYIHFIVLWRSIRESILTRTVAWFGAVVSKDEVKGISYSQQGAASDDAYKKLMIKV